MPRFDNPASLSVGLDGFLMPDISTVAVEDFANSNHSGRWGGGLLTINRVIHDISPYSNTNTAITLLQWPVSPDWKFVVTGAFMWGTFNWVSAAPIIRMGYATSTDAILVDWTVVNGVKANRGLLDVDYNAGFLRGFMVAASDGDIEVTFAAGTSGPLTGNASFSVWGYTIPDVESAGS